MPTPAESGVAGLRPLPPHSIWSSVWSAVAEFRARLAPGTATPLSPAPFPRRGSARRKVRGEQRRNAVRNRRPLSSAPLVVPAHRAGASLPWKRPPGIRRGAGRRPLPYPGRQIRLFRGYRMLPPRVAKHGLPHPAGSPPPYRGRPCGGPRGRRAIGSAEAGSSKAWKPDGVRLPRLGREAAVVSRRARAGRPRRASARSRGRLRRAGRPSPPRAASRGRARRARHGAGRAPTAP